MSSFIKKGKFQTFKKIKGLVNYEVYQAMKSNKNIVKNIEINEKNNNDGDVYDGSSFIINSLIYNSKFIP
jgi:hypothetical protein